MSKRDKGDYTFYLVGIRKGSRAEKGLKRDAKKHKYRYVASLISAMLDDRYEKLEGDTISPSLWFPDPRLLQVALGIAAQQPKQDEQEEETQEDTGEISQDQLLAMSSNLDVFLDEM